eukprot:gnl/TRDRNA2_/TRDRNA2_119600_c1_seq1.p2 gnl/TRDRNA2_/TRDRNA2_119600_c1~~gnl/TRDRNA2_/TRDRNA2_119600_c1_seq1.p2  ORF type:complete len:100 (-),score=19.26 gnl/TRDRNA2_/TRDRNA2_119600_c1_seq1:47-346(-)
MCCAAMPSRCHSAMLAEAANRAACESDAVAKAHTALARCCVLKSAMSLDTALDSLAAKELFKRPAAAKPHAVLARSRGVKLPMHCFVDVASMPNSTTSG